MYQSEAITIPKFNVRGSQRSRRTGLAPWSTMRAPTLRIRSGAVHASYPVANRGWTEPERVQDRPSKRSLYGARIPIRLIEPLTEREYEVLALLAEAPNNQQIAERLCIGLRTVETHLSHIYGKLGVRGRAGAMLWALRAGIVEARAPAGCGDGFRS